MAEHLDMEPTGHNPDVLVSALVHNRAKDKFLVAKRPGTLNKGCFETPGGPLEYGEDFPPCAARCVRRETGLEVTARSVVAVVGDVWHAGGTEKHIVTIFVLCDLKDDADEVQVKPAVEGEEWVWRSWQELRNEPDREIHVPLGKILDDNQTEKALLRRSL